LTLRRQTIIAFSAAGLTVLLVGLIVALTALTPPNRYREDLPPAPLWLALPIYPIVMASVGALIAYRRQENPIGWLMCVTAALGAVIELELFYTNYTFAGGTFALLRVDWMVWLSRCLWIPWVMLQLVYLPLVFPDGRLPSPRWGRLLWIAWGATAIAMAARAVDIRLMADLGLSNPVGIPDPLARIHLLAEAGAPALVLLATAALASVFIRERGASGDRKQQLKWFGYAIAFMVPVVVLGKLADDVLNPVFPLQELLIPTAFVCIPIAIAFAIFRYRLYDIDPIINRTLVYTMLAAIITAAYVAVVVGAGALLEIGTQFSLVPLLAAAGAAFAIQPVRVQLEKLANRVVYGRRASPYDALAALSRQTARTAPSDQLLTDALRAVCHGVGLPSASIWLRAGDEYRPVVEWPPHERQASVPMLPAVGRGVAVFPVRDRGEVLGVMSVKVPPGRKLSAADQRLLADIAGQAGLMLRNLNLAADLMARMAELRESRRRLVTTQEQERRRIERNLHDGAQQDLFNLKLGIRQARVMLKRNPRQVAGALKLLEHEADSTLATIKELARGVYPPLLTSQGIVAALTAKARTAPLEVHLMSTGVRRYAAEIEEAIYYACAEALQNAMQHARATAVHISIVDRDGTLTFIVQDNGVGFDATGLLGAGAGLQGMRDRIDVVGGSLEFVSSPGRGCEVRGQLRVSAVASGSGGGARLGEAQVQRGHREEVEQSSGHQPAEDHDRQRVLDLVPRPVAQHD
jgi:signal transduction histidine kinase